MTKPELISALAEKSCLSKGDATKAVDALFGLDGVIVSSLKKGDAVRLVGFGNFDVTKREARTGTNPKDGTPMQIAARKSPVFKAGKPFKDALN